MFDESDYSFTRYLSAKKSVDDRALNRYVWDKLRSNLAEKHTGKRLEILEVGAGIGTMFERSLEWGLFDTAHYMAIDAMSQNVSDAKARILGWAYNAGYAVENISETEFRLSGPGKDVALELECVDFFEFAQTAQPSSQWDMIMANAFMDLVDVRKTLPIILNLLRSNGVLYFTINFDGATIIDPKIDSNFDDLVERLYHQTMDERIIDGAKSGDSKTGRHLFEAAKRNNLEILEAGSSDWTVYAGKEGYREDEAYFLHFIIHTMYLALKDRPEIDHERFRNWIKKRHAQVEDGELVYIAHQLDFLFAKQDILKRQN